MKGKPHLQRHLAYSSKPVGFQATVLRLHRDGRDGLDVIMSRYIITYQSRGNYRPFGIVCKSSFNSLDRGISNQSFVSLARKTGRDSASRI